MRKYEKIETLYARDVEGTKKLIENQFRDPTIESLANITWTWTEKVDGTNIRVMWDGYKVSFGGRTDNAQIPSELLNRLNEIFMTSAAEEIFEQTFGEKEVIIFGEGYGKKIQKAGSHYLHDSVDFIVFDVLIGDNYQEREWVEKVALMFGIKAVPVVGEGTLFEAVDFVKHYPFSFISEDESFRMEGIVCRPKYELRDRCGKRIIVKIKWEDIKELVIGGLNYGIS